MAVTCEGIIFYDIRTCIKGEAGEAISMGESCYIANADGLIYIVDNGKSDVCHGWALMDYVAGDPVTLVTTAKMKVDTAQANGGMLYTGALAGGSAPSTTLAAAGVVVGYAYADYEVFVNVPTPTADG